MVQKGSVIRNNWQGPLVRRVHTQTQLCPCLVLCDTPPLVRKEFTLGCLGQDDGFWKMRPHSVLNARTAEWQNFNQLENKRKMCRIEFLRCV